jgi:hypothetical protein
MHIPQSRCDLFRVHICCDTDILEKGHVFVLTFAKIDIDILDFELLLCLVFKVHISGCLRVGNLTRP